MQKEKKKSRNNVRKQKYQTAKRKLGEILINALTDDKENKR